MRGHKALLAMRLSGKKPASVFVHVLDHTPVYHHLTDPETLFAGELPDIDILPTDTPALLDLRAIQGCVVHVLGLNADRTRSVAQHCKTFLPSEIIVAGFGGILRWRPKA